MISGDCVCICALQTSGMSVINTFASAMGDLCIITLDLMKKTKNNAIDKNIRHADNEIDMADLEGLERMKIGIIMPQVDCSVLPDGPDVIVLHTTHTHTTTTQ